MASELGQAYVQIIPSAKGISGSISKELGGAAEPAGKSAGGRLGGAIKGALATAGIGAALSKTLGEGADLEQSVGGIETLFKDSAGKMKEYASQAYKTAGVSANTYMETVTSFSASLLQSLGGDTAKAADTANMAMVDMSDNANKMGTNMEDIQNAYQGFAKQNYTMLDNLKLGYGGTKEEMERLLSDAEKFSGQKYDISNLNDVYSAIHVIQGELDITGTTAKEASTTLAGSFGSMKAAFSDFLGNLTLGNDIKPSLQALVQTASTYLFDNLLPAVGNIIGGLPSAIGTLLETGIPELMENGGKLIRGLVAGVTDGIASFGPVAGEILSTMIGGVLSGIPALISAGMNLILSLANGIVSSLPLMVNSATSAIQSFIAGASSALPGILQTAVQIINTLISGLVQNLPYVISSGIELVGSFLFGIVQNLPSILSAGWDIIKTLGQGLLDAIPAIITGIVDGIAKLFSNLWDFITGGADGAASSIEEKTKAISDSLANNTSVAATSVSSNTWSMASNVNAACSSMSPASATSTLTSFAGTASKNMGAISTDAWAMSGNVNDAFGNMDASGAKQLSSTVNAAMKDVNSVSTSGLKNMQKTYMAAFNQIVSMVSSSMTRVVRGIRSAAPIAGSAANAIARNILRPIQALPGQISRVIAQIKGLFHFSVNTPHIPVPHFRISPSGWKVGDLLHGSIPSLSVKWYATGGVFNRSSIIGVGEAGPEAVLPLTALWSKFSEMADSIVNGVGLQLAAAGAGSSGPVHLTLYLWPSGPKAGEWVVNTYDEYKRKKG